LEGQIGLSLSRLAAQRYGDGSKLVDDLKVTITAAAMAAILCFWGPFPARGQAVPASDIVRSNTDNIALYVGISNELARLREVSIHPTPENSSDRMWLHQHILEAVTASFLELDATVAQIDFEISNVNALRYSLGDARDRVVNRFILAGLVAGGGLGTVSSGLQLSQTQAHNSTLLGISAGALSSGFALAGLHAQHGGSRVFSAKSNMLAELFGREPLPDSRYPQSVEEFLNQVPTHATDLRSRGAHLIAAWVAEERIESPLSAAGKQTVDRVTSRPSQGIHQNIDDLDKRATMLADLRATMLLMKRDLATLLLSLPKAEVGEPYAIPR
jgi:hypothetical protein